MGFAMAAYPIDLMVASVAAMDRALKKIKDSAMADNAPLAYCKAEVDLLWEVNGFNEYRKEEQRYKRNPGPGSVGTET
jgi:hypothetical protein